MPSAVSENPSTGLPGELNLLPGSSLSHTFQDYRVIVTGSASGVGLGIAQHFAQSGAKVWICDQNPDLLKETLSAHQQPNSKYLFAGGSVCDVSKEEDVERCVTEAVGSDGFGGQLHILVNNAGCSGPTASVENISLTDFNLAVQVSLGGTFLFCKHAVPVLKKTKKSDGTSSAGQKNYTIINISSTAGFLGYPNRIPYASAKWAVVGLTKSLAIELGPDYGIRVNAIAPGSMNNPRMDGVIQREAAATNSTPEAVRANYEKQNTLRTFIDNEDIAGQVMYLCSSWGRRITGQCLAVDGMCESLQSV